MFANSPCLQTGPSSKIRSGIGVVFKKHRVVAILGVHSETQIVDDHILIRIPWHIRLRIPIRDIDGAHRRVTRSHLGEELGLLLLPESIGRILQTAGELGLWGVSVSHVNHA